MGEIYKHTNKDGQVLKCGDRVFKNTSNWAVRRFGRIIALHPNKDVPNNLLVKWDDSEMPEECKSTYLYRFK